MGRRLTCGIGIGLAAVLLPLVPALASQAASLPDLTAKPATVIAGPADTRLAFSVALSAASTSAVTVHYKTVNGTAVAGTNFDAATGTLTIPAGSTSGSVDVTALPVKYTATPTDLTFGLKLSHVTGAVLTGATATGTIHPDPYLAAVSGQLGDVVIGPRSHYAYITNTSENEVDVLNLTTGAYGKPIFVGSNPVGLDITPDGKYLYVCDSGGQTISVVDLAEGKTVKTILAPSGAVTAYWIGIASNGEAVYTDTFQGSGFGANVYLLNLQTDHFKKLTGGGVDGLITPDTTVFRTSDYSTVVGLLGEDSGGDFFTYHAKTGTVTSGAINNFVQWGAVNASGTELIADPGTYVADLATGTLLGTINSSGEGVVFAPSGRIAYSVGNGVINIMNVSRFLQTGTIPAPDATGGPGILVISPNGHTLVALTASGATIIRL